ncbi:hypothetical protein ONZ45_g18871 [Pleurotus djamor]|nr:hypothetical protein ONZ45_g18871 [Pleurotus djamor]
MTSGGGNEEDRIDETIPFPMVQGPSSSFSVAPVTEYASSPSVTPRGTEAQVSPVLGPDSTKPSQEALTNSSSEASKLTSSDKLSALPPPASPPTRHRAFRRSLDAPLPTSMSSSTPVLLPVDSGLLSDASHSSSPAKLSPSARHGTFPRNASDSSVGKATPRQRISFDSDRISLPTFQNVRQAFSRAGRNSDHASSPLHPQDARSPSLKHKEIPSDSQNAFSSRSPSHSRSRAASPLRFLRDWSAGFRGAHQREEPFIPVDPFQTKWKFNLGDSLTSCLCFWRDLPTDEEVGVTPESQHRFSPHIAQMDFAHTCEDAVPSCLPSRTKFEAGLTNTREFLSETLPRVLYLYLLLRLPAIYFSRVARIFRDAEVSQPDIYRMCEGGLLGSGFVPHMDLGESTTAATEAARRVAEHAPRGALASGLGFSAHVSAAAAAVPIPLPYPDDWSPPLVSPALVRFKNSWEAFIDSLLREWKTLNLVSALLLSAIMTMFQVPDAAYDPVTRTAALISMVCALMSLTYGCVYIVRFGTMRSMYRASRWAEEARKSYTLIWWNAWILLAMPSVWLAWSMISFLVCILSFVWRTGSTLDPHERDPMTPRAILGPRIAITAILVLGLLYFVLIIQSLKSYGSRRREVERRASLLRAGASVGMRERRADRGDADERERRGEGGERRGRERVRSQRRHHRHPTDAAPRNDRERGEVPAERPARAERGDKTPLSDPLGLGLLGIDDVGKDGASSTKSKVGVEIHVEPKH